MVWGRADHKRLSATTAEIDLETVPASETNLMLTHTFPTGGNGAEVEIKTNNSSGNDYTRRYNQNNGTDGTQTGMPELILTTGDATTDCFKVTYIINDSGNEKLFFTKSVSSGGSSPNYDITCGVDTKTAEMTDINVVNTYYTGDFASGSNISILGDNTPSSTVTSAPADEKATITNVPAGTRYEETDTRKIYRRNDPIWIERGEAGGALKVWLDADDSSTITKDGSNKVSQWNDKSGEANHVSNSTAGSQPLWVDSAQNSKPLIRFDGVDDFLQKATFENGDLSQPATVFAVVKMPSNYYKYAMSGSVSGKQWKVASGNSSAITFVMSAGGELETLNHYTNMRQYTLTYNGASSVARQSKTAYMSGDAGTEVLSGLTLAMRYLSAGSGFGACDWCELLIYEGAIDDSVRDSIEDYLATKWGL